MDLCTCFEGGNHSNSDEGMGACTVENKKLLFCRFKKTSLAFLPSLELADAFKNLPDHWKPLFSAFLLRVGLLGTAWEPSCEMWPIPVLLFLNCDKISTSYVKPDFFASNTFNFFVLDIGG